MKIINLNTYLRNEDKLRLNKSIDCINLVNIDKTNNLNNNKDIISSNK